MKETVSSYLIFTTCLKQIPPVKPGDTSGTHVIMEKAELYSLEEIERASQEVKQYFAGQFRFKDCKLNSLQYEEEQSAEKSEEKKEKIMVFRGFFEIGEDPVFKYRGQKFGDCIWEVKWSEEAGSWEVDRLCIL